MVDEPMKVLLPSSLPATPANAPAVLPDTRSFGQAAAAAYADAAHAAREQLLAASITNEVALKLKAVADALQGLDSRAETASRLPVAWGGTARAFELVGSQPWSWGEAVNVAAQVEQQRQQHQHLKQLRQHQQRQQQQEVALSGLERQMERQEQRGELWVV